VEVLCENCKARFKIEDEKIPTGQVVSFKCPKCKSKIKIDSWPQPQVATPAKTPQTTVDEVTSDTYDASEKSFDFKEEGVETALVCEHDPGVKQRIRAVLELTDYHVREAESAREALNYMRFYVFDLVVLNEKFDEADPGSNHVLKYLRDLPMQIRRNIFVVLLGDSFRTMDNMMAFNKSVNLVVNLKNIDYIENILSRYLAKREELYRVFKESLKEVGGA